MGCWHLPLSSSPIHLIGIDEGFTVKCALHKEIKWQGPVLFKLTRPNRMTCIDIHSSFLPICFIRFFLLNLIICLWLSFWKIIGEAQMGCVNQTASLHSFYLQPLFNKLFILPGILMGIKYIEKNTSLVKVMLISDSVFKFQLFYFFLTS